MAHIAAKRLAGAGRQAPSNSDMNGNKQFHQETKLNKELY
jgi:hypothetical protein